MAQHPRQLVDTAKIQASTLAYLETRGLPSGRDQPTVQYVSLGTSRDDELHNHGG